MNMRRLFCLFCALLMFLTTSSAEKLPMPSVRGQRGSHVLALQKALIAVQGMEGEADGYFSARTMAALMAFQKDRGMKPDGRADAHTLRLLFDELALREGKPRRVYWYGGGSGIVPMGARLEVLDVRSGISFRCVRVWGQSHLDAEPLTPWDSFQMLTAYDGEWRYDRRPILLRYRNRLIAASMMGKPHGHEIIPGNGMVGHFCIHFYASRGDGSQRVDADHQACVLEALSAAWPQK